MALCGDKSAARPNASTKALSGYRPRGIHRVRFAMQETPSPFVIDAILDSSITDLAASSPALYGEITGAITAAVQFYETRIVSSMTISIDFGFGEINNQPLASGALGESIDTLFG